MTRTLLALVAGCTLAAPYVANAQQGSSGSTIKEQPMPSTADEPKKHLGELDGYLRDAINSTKLLYENTQLQPGKLDTVIENEDLSNIDKALSGAMTHVSHIKSMPEAHVTDMAAIDSLSRDFTQARSLVGQLRTAVKAENRDQVAMLSSQLYARLRDADDRFSTIADKQSMTRVDKISVPERQPMGGHGMQPRAPQKQPQGGGGYSSFSSVNLERRLRERSTMGGDDSGLFEGLAEFEVDFFRDLVRSYAKLDLGMRGFFYHRIKQVVKEAIDLLRAERQPPPTVHRGKPD